MTEYLSLRDHVRRVSIPVLAHLQHIDALLASTGSTVATPPGVSEPIVCYLFHDHGWRWAGNRRLPYDAFFDDDPSRMIEIKYVVANFASLSREGAASYIAWVHAVNRLPHTVFFTDFASALSAAKGGAKSATLKLQDLVRHAENLQVFVVKYPNDAPSALGILNASLEEVEAPARQRELAAEAVRVASARGRNRSSQGA